MVIVPAAVWAATQWMAWLRSFQPQLGDRWFFLGPGMPVYLPPAFFWWRLLYGAYAPRVFHEGACIAASGGVMSAVVALGLSIGGRGTVVLTPMARPDERRRLK
jgi:type IV secretion system protein VirD4